MAYRSQENLFEQPGLEVAPAREDKYFVGNGDQSDKQVIAQRMKRGIAVCQEPPSATDVFGLIGARTSEIAQES